MRRTAAAAALLLAALAGCGSARDCSPAARLAELAAERAAFRRTIAPLGSFGGCPSTNPEVLIPEENRVSAYKSALTERIRASALRPDLDQVQSEGLRASENVYAQDCVGFRWRADEARLRDGRRGLASEMAQLQAMDAAFQRLVRQVVKCPE